MTGRTLFGQPLPEPFSLRPYQSEAVANLRKEMMAGAIRLVLSAPTGAGKTIIMSHMLRLVAEKGRRAIIIAPRAEIVAETTRKFRAAGLDIGLISGPATWGTDRPILVASAQTLERRGIPRGISLAVVDECHEIRTRVLDELIFEKIRTIGMTATPLAPRLRVLYQGLVSVCSTDDLIREGWLAPPRIFPGVPVETDGLTPTGTGEWRGSDLEDRTLPVIGDVVDGWETGVTKHFGAPVKTLVFAPTIASGADFVRRWGDRGHHFEQVGALVSPEERAASIAAFREDPEVCGLVSCTALEMGADFPEVKCLVIARAYRKAVAPIIQQFGRGMRASAGKEYTLVHDHVRNYVRHAEEIDAFWADGISELPRDGSRPPSEVLGRKAAERKTPTCKKCGMVLPRKMAHCVQCGTPRPQRQVVAAVQGDLREVHRGTVRKPKPSPAANRTVWPDNLWDQVAAIVQRDTESPPDRLAGRAKAIYRGLTGRWPPWGSALDNPAPVDTDIDEAVTRQRRAFFARHRRRR